MKATSAGLVLTNRDVFLTCHSTGNRFFDLPKGLPELGETPVQAACRELREETGLSVHPERLMDLGIFPYIRSKDLHLFYREQTNFPERREWSVRRCSPTDTAASSNLRWMAANMSISIAGLVMTENMAHVIGEVTLRIRALI